MDLICVDDKYSKDQLEFWELHGVSHPIAETMYTLGEIVKHSNGQVGFRLEEIKNPKVPVKSMMGVIEIEPSFNHKRFRHLNGDDITAEELRELIRKFKPITT